MTRNIKLSSLLVGTVPDQILLDHPLSMQVINVASNDSKVFTPEFAYGKEK